MSDNGQHPNENKDNSIINDPLTDHSYDGIQEYDNPLPTWWIFIFIGTVIFAFHYYLHYQIAGGPTLQDELKIEMAEHEKLLAAALASGVTETEEELTEKMKSPDVVSAGMAVFVGKCAACHGDKGQGIIGPNLTDKFWIHGEGKRTDIIKLVRKGALDKGMPAWEQMLKPDEVIQVVAFVHSLIGSNPPQAKPPQGNEVK